MAFPTEVTNKPGTSLSVKIKDSVEGVKVNIPPESVIGVFDKVEYETIWCSAQSAAGLSTGAPLLNSLDVVVYEAKSINVEVITDINFVRGSLAGLKLYVQAASIWNGSNIYYNVPTVNNGIPLDLTPSVDGLAVIIAFQIPSIYYALRFGFASTAVGSAGSINVLLNLRK